MLARLYSYWGGEKLVEAAKNAQEVIDFEWTDGKKALFYTEMVGIIAWIMIGNVRRI